MELLKKNLYRNCVITGKSFTEKSLFAFFENFSFSNMFCMFQCIERI